jgi:ribosomal protein L18E
MDNTLDSAGRADLSRALGLVGKDRSNEAMQRIAKNGGVYLSLEQAYQEFSTSRQVDNEMLIM